MSERRGLAAHLGQVLADATIPELPNHYAGKVRDNYDLADGRRIIIATDRLSAFDRIIAAIPLKGQVLTQIARFWFDATRDICPNHVIEYPDPNVLLCRRLAIMPVEIVVRDYLAGTTATSIWSMYQAGRREMYGLRFADGLRQNQKLPATVITPTTKAFDGGHDEPLSADRDPRRQSVDLAAVANRFGAGLGAVRARARSCGRARADPGRHQVRVRFRPRGPYRIGRRNPHPGQQPLLAGAKLSAPFRRRPTAGEPRQGFRAPLGRRPLRSLPRSAPGNPAPRSSPKPPVSMSRCATPSPGSISTSPIPRRRSSTASAPTSRGISMLSSADRRRVQFRQVAASGGL